MQRQNTLSVTDRKKLHGIALEVDRRNLFGKSRALKDAIRSVPPHELDGTKKEAHAFIFEVFEKVQERADRNEPEPPCERKALKRKLERFARALKP